MTKRPPFLPSFARDRRGATAMLFAISAIPALMAIGTAIDIGRAQVAKSRLASAIDSAALAVATAHTLDDAGKKKLAQDYINANFTPSMGTLQSFTMQENEDEGTVDITATVRVYSTFLAFFGKEHLDVVQSTQVKAAENALMVSLVLDLTGSMWSNNNIGSLRTASLDLIGILFGNETENENLRVALVPYAASVNPGTVSSTLVAAGHGLGASGSTALLGWKGCVVERAPPHTLADTPPSAGQYWTPFRYPVANDNRWDPNDQRSVEPGGTSNSNGFRGPNLGCPNPIVPLTQTRSTLTTAINNFTAWNRGGTLTDIGLAWGIRTLSPGAPFSESAAIDPITNQPLWESERWQKAIVLMTDGESTFFRMTGTQSATNQPPSQGYSRPANTEVTAGLTDYTGYGRFGEALATSIFNTTNLSTANGALNTRIENLCTTAKNQGITVYTVVFTSGVGPSVRAMYERCASDPGKYWYAPSQGALRSAFRSIGKDLVRLHVSA